MPILNDGRLFTKWDNVPAVKSPRPSAWCSLHATHQLREKKPQQHFNFKFEPLHFYWCRPESYWIVRWFWLGFNLSASRSEFTWEEKGKVTHNHTNAGTRTRDPELSSQKILHGRDSTRSHSFEVLPEFHVDTSASRVRCRSVSCAFKQSCMRWFSTQHGCKEWLFELA